MQGLIAEGAARLEFEVRLNVGEDGGRVDDDTMTAPVMHAALRRAGQPEEIVGAALFFATDASSFTSGAVLRVDGGLP